MSTIRTAITTVKNFFVNLVTPPPEENLSDENSFYSNRFLARKRPATNIYEPEITDDEDDLSNFPYYPPCSPVSSKRLRVESNQGPEMASRQTPSKYVTRGSGRPPHIEGLNKQPWEFSFPPRRRPAAQEVAQNQNSQESSCLMGRLRGSESDEILKRKVNAVTSSSRSDNNVSDKDVEVITLDGDESQPSTSKNMCVQKQFPAVPRPWRQKQPGSSSPARSLRARDNNRFSKYLSAVGQKITKHSPSIRIKEKLQYRELLQFYNVISSKGHYQTSSALTKSIVNTEHLQVIYNTFGTSPTKGAVTFRRNGKALSNESRDFSTPADCKALVPVPRLFSTPNEDELCSVTPASPPKAITYRSDPELVDLEAEPSCSSNIVSCISPITPVTTRCSYPSSTPGNVSGVGNFTNLEDALNKSALPEESFLMDKEKESGVLALEDSPKEDEDISIIAENIVKKSRGKSVNTLALEQTDCPYVEKRWLDASKTSWRSNRQYRDQRIQEEMETLKILNRESTLERDLEDRIRKKLTLTEIIVLEETPEQMPELTDEMMSIINYAKSRGNDNEVLAQVRLPKDTISIIRGDVRTLGPSQWLNDNVINTYMGLIVLRSKEGKYPSVYAFQTFFYPKLLKEGYSNSLKRWTRKDDIFAHDLIILPIHLGLHWCLACIDFRSKTIRYYDSLGGDNGKCLKTLLDYIAREMKERKQQDLDKNEWSLENVKGIPQQQNGSDCGMFSCKFAEYLSRDAPFTFTQEHMPYYRDRMIYELIKSDLLHP